jgi:hypothetical protein
MNYEEWHLLGYECGVGLVRADISEERIASIIRVERISDLSTMKAITCN